MSGGMSLGLGLGLTMQRGGGGGAALAVEDQSLTFGALTLSGAGGVRPVHTGSPAGDFQISGGNSANYSVDASTGEITPSSDGAATDADTFTWGDGTTSATIMISAGADAYSVKTNSELTSVLAIAVATLSGKTVKFRKGQYSAVTVKNKTYTSVVTFASDDNDNRAEVAQFTIQNSTNVKVTQFFLHNATITSGAGIVTLTGPTDGVEITDNEIKGIAYDHAADYSVSAYPGNANGIVSNASDGDINDTIIRDNYLHELSEGITMGAVTGNIEIAGNEVAYRYEDAVKIGRIDDFGTYTYIKDNVLHGCLSKAGDANLPHGDAIQLLGTGLTADWTGIEIDRNIIFCEERGTVQPIFLKGSPADTYFSGAKIRGNVCLSKGTSNGLTIERAKDCIAIGNTVADQNPDGEGNTTVLHVGSTQSSGTHRVWQNIAESVSVGGTPNSQNNISLGKSGATIAYTTVFAGSTFDPQTKTEVLAKFAMLANGPADIDDSGDASIYDAGAIGSGYVTFASATPGRTGAALDASYESNAYTQNLVDTNGTAYFTSISLGAIDTALWTFAFEFVPAEDSKTYDIFSASGRSLIKMVSGQIDIQIKSTANTVLYDATGQTTSLAADGPKQYLIIADLGATPSVNVYIDGVLETMTEATAATTGTIDHTRPSYGILASEVGGLITDGQVADIYSNMNAALAVTDFYDGAPLDISAAGSPEVFLGGSQTADDYNAGTNLGSGGVLTVGSATFTDV